MMSTPAHRRIRRGQRCLTDRKSTRLNSSHSQISYAVFCLKKKKKQYKKLKINTIKFTDAHNQTLNYEPRLRRQKLACNTHRSTISHISESFTLTCLL